MMKMFLTILSAVIAFTFVNCSGGSGKKDKTAQETVQQTKTVVTAETYIRAQTDNMFQTMINNSGGTVETEINGVLSACTLRDLDHHSNTPLL